MTYIDILIYGHDCHRIDTCLEEQTCNHHPTEVVEKKRGHVDEEDDLELGAVTYHLSGEGQMQGGDGWMV